MASSKASDPMSLSGLKAGGFFVAEAKRVETAKEVQKQLLDLFERFSQERIARANQEIEIACEFAARVTGARSVPDFMNTYQNWIAKQMALVTEDSQKLLQDSQSVVSAAMKLLSIGREKEAE